MKRMLIAMQFLSVIPVRVSGDLSAKEIGESSIFFPAVGALQGLLLLASGLLLMPIFPPDITAAFIVALMIVFNGGFHMDGLADTFDALAVKSSGDAAADRKKRLAVMKDSTTGAIGVVTVVMVLLLKYVLIKNLLSSAIPFVALLALSLMPVFSKWVMVPAMYLGKPAREKGLGALFINETSLRCLVIASMLTLFLFGVVSGFYLPAMYGMKGLVINLALPAGYLISYAAAAGCEKVFGGLTGDTLGALGELSEIFYLTGVYIWLQHFI
jgi:adenosylcobinamide-GDP ribazoletransferase